MPYWTINPQTGEREYVDERGNVIQAPTEPSFQGSRGSLFQNIKKGLSGLGKVFFPATKNYIQDVGQLAGIKSKAFGKAQESIQASQGKSAQLRQQANRTQDQARKRQLLSAAKQVEDLSKSAIKTAEPEFSSDIDKNPFERGLAVGSEVAPLALTPVAKGITPMARVASMAKQGALLSGARSATSLEEMEPKERLKKTLVDAGLGALIVGGIQAGGELVRGTVARTTKVGKGIAKKGSAIRQDVRQIKEPAGVWGADKEDAINKTLDKVGIKGTPSEQYKQLSGKYNKLTKSIDKYLDEESVAVKSKSLSEVITQDLKDLPGDVTANRQGKLEYKKILKEVGKVKNSKELFGLKKWLNGRLGRVYTKIEKGSPLSPAEEVILTARDTVDGMITQLHPTIKDLTIAQSHLRDAAPSLARSRNIVPTLRVAGTTVPMGLASKAKDIAGRTLQRTGQALTKTGEAETSALAFAKPVTKFAGRSLSKAAPILLTPSSAIGENVPDVPQETQQKYPQIGQNQQSQAIQGESYNHPSSIAQGIKFVGGEQAISTQPKTVTGYTTTQLQQALAKATMAGAKTATKQLTALLKLEQDYQESKETEGGGIKLTENQKKQMSNLTKTQDLVSSIASEALKISDESLAPYARIKGLGLKAGGKVGALPTELQNKVSSFSRVRKGMRIQIARGLGEVGNLSLPEQEAALDLLPDIGMSSGEIAENVRLIQEILEQAKQRTLQYGGGASSPNQLQFQTGEQAL